MSASKNYKDTILLPNTSFPMRADLVVNEPKRLKQWEDAKLYQQIIAKGMANNAPKFVLHDGPPFANGDVHMGTALNKILKDLVVKSKTMSGYVCPFTPGWDCHGLPIEYKVVQKAAGLEPAEIRRRCEEFAKGFIDIQRDSFRRLGVFADWYNPYLTLDPQYEASIIEVFAKLLEDGAIYQSKKPVQWSFGAHTALAEAEIEYFDKVSDAVFVKFDLLEAVQGHECAMVIWTTTPWTLPANVAIALHPRLDYVLASFVREGKVQKLVLLKALIEEFSVKTGWAVAEIHAEFNGASLEGLQARHPFLERTSVVINAEYVSDSSGTGAVHIAPGHGSEDYVASRSYGLPVLSPVDDDGKFTEEVGLPQLVGQHVFSANPFIVELLGEREMLLGHEKHQHSYPHCWRSKTPVIFRAVEQFFISIEKIRPQALSEIDKVEWLPAWGRNRIYGTVEARPDWCISRQRTWGVPLPVFFDENNQAVLDAGLCRKVAEIVAAEGSNVWFELSDAEWCQRLGLPAGYSKCRDTLDVWIDSGSSWHAVLGKKEHLSAPADLYLEATDQHRGWFQSSLMLSVAWGGKAPYRAVMTHGFVVDKDTRKKTSKSDAKSGKPTDAVYFYDKYGADIVRLWVSSVDWQNEVPFGEELFQQVTEPYRRLRNTLRILLGNLHDFDASKHSVPAAELPLLDRWIMEGLGKLIEDCKAAYQAYDFRKVFTSINQFCTADLSAVYVDVTKDRMYCDAADSLRRRASQTVMHAVFDALCRLLAPILSYTADEAWEHAGNSGSVHLQSFPQAAGEFATPQATPIVERLFELRKIIQTAIEAQIQAKAFNKNNEAAVQLVVTADEPALPYLQQRDFVTEFFIIADLQVEIGEQLKATAGKTTHAMCPRCRRYEPAAGEHGLCARCASVME